ncbi:hypothetical protein OC845_000718 [Tilletia horrida]|nr:hypothetical protein OC845_000718 [Tilletia horrida]
MFPPLVAIALSMTSSASALPLLNKRQGSVAGINSVLSEAGQNALDKAQHRTAGLSTTQLSILIAVLLLVLGLGCFGLWYICGARAQRRHRKQEQEAAKAEAEAASRAGGKPLPTIEKDTYGNPSRSGWTKFDNESGVHSSTALNKF